MIRRRHWLGWRSGCILTPQDPYRQARLIIVFRWRIIEVSYESFDFSAADYVVLEHADRVCAREEDSFDCLEDSRSEWLSSSQTEDALDVVCG